MAAQGGKSPSPICWDNGCLDNHRAARFFVETIALIPIVIWCWCMWVWCVCLSVRGGSRGRCGADPGGISGSCRGTFWDRSRVRSRDRSRDRSGTRSRDHCRQCLTLRLCVWKWSSDRKAPVCPIWSDPHPLPKPLSCGTSPCRSPSAIVRFSRIEPCHCDMVSFPCSAPFLSPKPCSGCSSMLLPFLLHEKEMFSTHSDRY